MSEQKIQRALFLYDILQLLAETHMGMRDILLWSGESGPRAAFNMSDTFEYACADGEEITPENLPALRQAYEDCKATGCKIPYYYAPLLFACRQRGMRPMPFGYPRDETDGPVIRKLIDDSVPQHAPGGQGESDES